MSEKFHFIASEVKPLKDLPGWPLKAEDWQKRLPALIEQWQQLGDPLKFLDAVAEMLKVFVNLPEVSGVSPKDRTRLAVAAAVAIRGLNEVTRLGWGADIETMLKLFFLRDDSEFVEVVRLQLARLDDLNGVSKAGGELDMLIPTGRKPTRRPERDWRNILGPLRTHGKAAFHDTAHADAQYICYIVVVFLQRLALFIQGKTRTAASRRAGWTTVSADYSAFLAELIRHLGGDIDDGNPQLLRVIDAWRYAEQNPAGGRPQVKKAKSEPTKAGGKWREAVELLKLCGLGGIGLNEESLRKYCDRRSVSARNR